MTVSRIKAVGITLIALFALLPSYMIAANNTNTKKLSKVKKGNSHETSPDFAFPETVISNAEIGLKKAATEGNTAAQIDYAIQLVIANNIISTGRAPEMAQLLDSLATTSTPQGAAILYSIEAQLYTDIYRSNRWLYNELKLPLNSYPEDPTLWSAELFAQKVYSLVKKSLSQKNVLTSSPAKDWKKLLDNTDSQALDCYPTLYSILAQRGIKLLDTFSNGEEPIPFGNESQNLSPSQKCNKLRENIITEWNTQATNTNNVAELTVTIPYTLLDKNSETCYNTYLEAYEKYKSSPYSCEFVYNMFEFAPSLDIVEDSEDLQRIYNDDNILNIKDQLQLVIEKLKECIANHPEYYRIKEAQNIINRIKREKGEVFGLQSFYSSRQDVSASVMAVNYSNAPYLCIYKLPRANMRQKEITQALKAGNCRFIKCVPTKSGNILPDTCNVNFGKLEIGHYLITAAKTSDGRVASILDPSDFSTFTVTDMYLTKITDSSLKKSNKLAILNPDNGQPCENVTVVISGTNKNAPKDQIATSDNQGMISIAPQWNGKNIRIKAKKGKDEFISNTWISDYTYSQEEEMHAAIFTDLALYKPGDTCNFSIVAYSCDPKEQSYKTLPAEELSISLINSSWQPCDTITLVTDADGRASGSFVLPENGMLGRYSINAVFTNTDKKGNAGGTTSIRVEEYKQPTFYVELDKPENIVAGEDLTLSGKALTYSGMPVTNADVNINIEQQRLWWLNNKDGSYNTETKTDAEGNFKCVLTTERIKGTDFENSILSIKASATSEAGETQESDRVSLCIGRIAKIEYIGKKIFNADNKNIILRYSVTGGNAEQQPVSYTVADKNGKIITDGTSPCPTITLNGEKFPSGTYTVTVNTLGTSEKTTIVIYRPTDKTVPTDTPLWVPETNITAPSNADHINIQTGSSYPDSYILYIISNNTGILSKGILALDNPSIKEISVPVSKKRNDATKVLLMTMRNSQAYTSTIYVTSAEAKENIEVEKISFRDKISSGGKEVWTFRYKSGSQTLVNLPVIATLTDAALNAITPFEWNRVYTNSFSDRIYTSPLINNYNLNYSFFGQLDYLRVPNILIPDFNTYSTSLYKYFRPMAGNIRIRGRGTAASVSSLDYANEEMVLAEEVVVTTSTAYGYRSAVADESTQSKKMSLTGSVSITSEDKGAEGGAIENDSDIKFRPSEMPIAWFKPNLKTDNNGILEISFDVPDFNTTWQLQMFGYTTDMQNRVSIMQATASKAVMISANSPRFLRTGDRTILMATIYNNSDKASRLAGRMELFNPLDNTTVLTKEYESQIVEPMGSRTIALEFNVPDNLEFIGYRCVGTAPGFSDGEQSLIAIMTSSSPVIESYPFYIAPDTDQFSMKLPKMDKNAQISLQYCDNPVWECVIALPDMSFNSSASILSRANRLYGNAIANGLVRQYPQLAEAIKAWSAEGDTTLISPLERNPELKVVALSNTPWINNAQGETLRMAKLTELLDTKKNESVIQEAINTLGKEQKNGGWSWCEGMEPSVFITTQILWRLAMLESMGYLPNTKDIQKIVKAGLKFCDSQLYDEYIESKKHFSTTSMLNYLYIRSFFPNAETGKNFASLKAKAVKAIESEWKEFSIYDKATAATLLWREKRPMAARSILESLKQHASRSQDRGMWFDNLRSYYSNNTLITTAQALEAYAEISPEAPEIDLLRQWLIIERQAQDWGQDAQLAEVIHAILTTGSDWTQSHQPAKLTLNGKEIVPPHKSILTGSFTIPLSASEAGNATLKIEKYGNHQSWGGVITQYIAPIEDVKAFSQSDVKISKRILTVDQTKDGLSLRPIEKESVAKGQRIRVQITVSSKRDIDYAVITDERSGCMSPVEQISGYTLTDGIGYYREVRNDRTNFFLSRLPKGDFLIEYDCFADREGSYSTGIATIQSLYAPSISAHSAGGSIKVNQ